MISKYALEMVFPFHINLLLSLSHDIKNSALFYRWHLVFFYCKKSIFFYNIFYYPSLFSMNIFQKIIISLVRVYQLILSPDHSLWAKALHKPPYCKHYPSCSNYMIEAVEKKWALIGVLKGVWRIMRCMPWNKWGYDPVEKDPKHP